MHRQIPAMARLYCAASGKPHNPPRAIHHGRGLHRYNYADMPVFDMVFGTFRNPQGYEMEIGFYHGASARVIDMLTFRDVATPDGAESAPLKEVA